MTVSDHTGTGPVIAYKSRAADCRKPYWPANECTHMNTVIVVSVLSLILVFIFFVYLLVRRTAQGFKEGMEGN